MVYSVFNYLEYQNTTFSLAVSTGSHPKTMIQIFLLIDDNVFQYSLSITISIIYYYYY